MRTVNISLTNDQFELVEKRVQKLGFANRSEFFRALIRTVMRKPEVLSSAEEVVFEPPPTRSIKKMMKGFRDTGKYSEEFLKNLEKGLKRSSYFHE